MGKHFFTQAQELYATANVYPADYSSMKRFLCKFDAEGKCLFFKDITKQAGKNVSLDRLAVVAPAYYTGQKSAEDAMKVIQNRVSLYVKENL